MTNLQFENPQTCGDIIAGLNNAAKGLKAPVQYRALSIVVAGKTSWVIGRYLRTGEDRPMEFMGLV